MGWGLVTVKKWEATEDKKQKEFKSTEDGDGCCI